MMHLLKYWNWSTPVSSSVWLSCGRVCLFSFLVTTSLYVRAQQATFFNSADSIVNIGEFDRNVQKMMAGVGVPAASIAVIEDNEIVYFNTYGLRNKEKKKLANNKTIFEGASLTKIFLVYVVNRLIEQGRFDLDKPMYQYLEHEQLKHDTRYKLITPRMIMCHSSGIENWRRDNDPDVLEILEDPGTEFVYSGEGYQYLARVVSLILGKSYEAYITEMVINPFGLERTFMKYRKTALTPFQKGATGNYAIGYSPYGKPVSKWKNHEAVPASGVHTTARALAKLLVGIMNGENLSHARIDSICTPQISIPEPGQQSGLGFFLAYTDQDSVIFFGGVNTGFRSYMFYSFKYKRGFVFQSNAETGWMMILELNRLTAHLKIDQLFEGISFMQYPSKYIYLQNIFREQDRNKFLVAVQMEIQKGTLSDDELKTLADWVGEADQQVAEEVMKQIGARGNQSTAPTSVE